MKEYKTLGPTQFGIGDGVRNRFSVGRIGDVVRRADIETVRKVGWQGDQILSPVPRTNMALFSNDFTNILWQGNPSLLSDFLSGMPSEGWSYRRDSSATYWGEDGILHTAAVDEPVIEYDPATGVCLGLRTEAAATNFAPWSQQMFTTWANVSSSGPTENDTGVIYNAAISPSGEMNASKLVERLPSGSASGYNRAYRSLTGMPGTASDNYSVFLKAGERTKAGIRTSLANTEIVIDLVTGELPVNRSNGVSQYVGNGWWRVSGVFDLASNLVIWVYIVNDAGEAQYAGDGVSGIYAFGAQATIGPALYSYIPTVSTAQVTRAADIVTRPLTADNFNPAEGTLFFDRPARASEGTAVSAGVSIGSNSANRIDLDSSDTSGIRLANGWNGMPAIPNSPGIPSKYAVTWRKLANGNVVFTGVINGVVGFEDVELASNGNGNLDTFNQLKVGGILGTLGYQRSSQHANQISLYKRALSTAELQALTS